MSNEITSNKVISNIEMKVSTKTPIEIAIGIDEEGMTTARRLYDFLELNPAHYARWCKKNIIENEFAEEGVDYISFTLNGERESGQRYNPNPTKDYKLTATFAKKLSMMARNERGEQAKNYFITVENLAVKQATEMANLLNEMKNNPMKVMEIHYKAIQQIGGEVNILNERVDSVEKKVNTFEMDISLLPYEADQIAKTVKKVGVNILGGKKSAAYHDSSVRARVYMDIHADLRRNFNVRSYKAIKRSQYDKAVEIVENYKVPLYLSEEISRINLVCMSDNI